jgi:hypothetical protein
MTNAPERIWIEGAVSNEVWKHDKQSCLSPHEYTRTDLIAAMIEEAVQAEREACAEAVESLWAYRTCSEVAVAIRARKGGEA